MNYYKMFLKLLFWLFFVLFSVFCGAYDTVWDPTACGDLVEQINYLQLQLSSLRDQFEVAKETIKSLNPSGYSWSSISQNINDLGNVINQANTIAYNAKNLDSKFKNMFPGYTPPSDYGKQYSDIINTTQNTLNASLQSLGANADTFADESKRLALLQSQSQTAEGQTQAIQAANQIALEETSQIQSLRQVAMAQTNAETTYYAAQVQKDADAEGALNDAIDKSYKDVNGKLDANPINDNFDF